MGAILIYLFCRYAAGNRRRSFDSISVASGRRCGDRDISTGSCTDDREKAANMAEQMNIPVLGIIENYSYVKCPDCGKEIKVFGESHVEEAAREMNVPVLGRMPIDMKLAEAVENEKFYEAENPYLADVKL